MKKTLALIVVLAASTLSFSAQKPLKKIDFLTNYVFLGRHAPFFVGLEKGYYRDAGFELVSSVGRSAVEMIKKEVALFDKYEAAFKFLAKIRAIPKKTDALLQRLHKSSQSYIQAEEAELLTLNWHCVGQKPE